MKGTDSRQLRSCMRLIRRSSRRLLPLPGRSSRPILSRAELRGLSELQQALLLGDLHLSERRLRALVANPEWGESSLGGTVVQNQE